MTMKTGVEIRGPMDAPDWFVTRCEELSRLMSSTPKDVADGLWLELIRRDLVQPNIVPGRVLGPLGWTKTPDQVISTGTSSVASGMVIQSE